MVREPFPVQRAKLGKQLSRICVSESLEALEATKARLNQTDTLEDVLAGSVQAHGKSFRARVPKGQKTVFGPCRATPAAAQQDLRELTVTRGESLEALEATQVRLRQNNTLEDSLVAGSVQAHGKSFRARVAKGKETVFGPSRATRKQLSRICVS